MKLVIDIKDPDIYEPKFYVDDDGKIIKVEIEAPFISYENLEPNDPTMGERVIVSHLRKCPECGIPKTRNQFYPAKGNKIGVQRLCIPCDKRRRSINRRAAYAKKGNEDE